ncbi:MAG: cytochrome C [Planctomycetaceae bacterium]|nr:cytochrome C [Planctomycetaceae bacterium]
MMLQAVLIGGILLVTLLFSALFAVVRSPDITNQNVTIEQTVPFSHQHHVGDIGIDCRYCHQSVETSAIAGVPPTQVCMNCHRELWNQSEMLAPVRESWETGQPLVWNRVHDLPDYVYFNHSIHIHKGIGCYECHGEVDQMRLTRQAEPLTMHWCLDCHRNPEAHVRPRSLVFTPKPLEDLADTTEFQEAVATLLAQDARDDSGVVELLRQRLATDYHLDERTDCYTCHR